MGSKQTANWDRSTFVNSPAGTVNFDVWLTVGVPLEMKKRVAREAKRKKISMSAWLREVIGAELDDPRFL